MGAVAMALSRIVPSNRAMIWTAALGIALTRVVLLAHWLSDVAVGTAAGAGLESLLHALDHRSPE
jgi:undecaprenyl-diphosphatase